MNVEIGLQLLFTIEYKFVHINSSSTLFCEATVTNYILVLFFFDSIYRLILVNIGLTHQFLSTNLNSRIPKEKPNLNSTVKREQKKDRKLISE